LVGASKVYSGLGADIVYGIITLKTRIVVWRVSADSISQRVHKRLCPGAWVEDYKQQHQRSKNRQKNQNRFENSELAHKYLRGYHEQWYQKSLKPYVNAMSHSRPRGPSALTPQLYSGLDHWRYIPISLKMPMVVKIGK